jgi:hypothetical protein
MWWWTAASRPLCCSTHWRPAPLPRLHPFSPSPLAAPLTDRPGQSVALNTSVTPHTPTLTPPTAHDSLPCPLPSSLSPILTPPTYMQAPYGSPLAKVTKLMMRLDNLSHVVIWSSDGPTVPSESTLPQPHPPQLSLVAGDKIPDDDDESVPRDSPPTPPLPAGDNSIISSVELPRVKLSFR